LLKFSKSRGPRPPFHTIDLIYMHMKDVNIDLLKMREYYKYIHTPVVTLEKKSQTLILLIPGGSPTAVSIVTRWFTFKDCKSHCFDRALQHYSSPAD